jgi:uncharacterized protein YndB with AHSA1/START domain
MESIKHLLLINSPRDKVYKAISTIDGLSNWWTSDTKGDSKPGGEIEFRFGPYPPLILKVSELKDNEIVEWKCESDMMGWKDTKLKFLLDDQDDKTRVRFEHSNWKETDDDFAAVSFTWTRYLSSLKQFCQTGEGEAFGSPGYRM